MTYFPRNWAHVQTGVELPRVKAREPTTTAAVRRLLQRFASDLVPNCRLEVQAGESEAEQTPAIGRARENNPSDRFNGDWVKV
jgi:hypothetical protein